MKRHVFLALILFACSMGCASVDSIRERDPAFRAEAKQDVIEFRDCVFDALVSTFNFINKTSNGVVQTDNFNNIVYLIEQSGGFVTAWESPFWLGGDVPELAAEKCNDDPDVGLFDFR